MNTSTDTPNASKSAAPEVPVLWRSSRVHGSLTLVLILLAAFLFAETINALKAYQYIGTGVTPSDTIVVTGTGEKFARPDTAEFSFTVHEEGDTAAAVESAGATKADAIVKALTDQGIAQSDIRTTSYAITPKYEWQPATCTRFPCDRKQVQNGFQLDETVQVKVRDLSKTGEALSVPTAQGASTVSGLTFTVGDEAAVKADARSLAIADAKTNADKLATDLGVSLIRIVNFSENNYPTPVMAKTFAADTAHAPEAAPTPTVPAGENQYTSNVTITYEVR